jgi:hypothetical protein
MCHVSRSCDDFSLYFSGIYLAPDVAKRAYELFVEDIEAITDNSELRDVILILGNLESGAMMPLNVTSDLKSAMSSVVCLDVT